MMYQLTLFPKTIRSAYLEADSKKNAWYEIVIEDNAGLFRIIKRSGIAGRQLDKRSWWMPGIDAALKMFKSKLRQKINPRSKRQRIYNIIDYLW